MASEIPPGFVDLYSASMRLNVDINVMGVVTDFLPPAQSKGPDLMCTFSLADYTSGYGYGDGQKVKYFRPKTSELPDIRGTGDVVMLWNVRVKEWSGMNFILSGRSSIWAIFHQKSIPESASLSQLRVASVKEKKAPEPKPAEVKYAIALCNSRDRASYSEPVIPMPISDQVTTNNGTATLSAGFKDKFSLIQDLVIGRYFDLTGQVVKVYPDQNCTELYITDYTTNTFLYNYEWGCQGENSTARDGDEYGYAPARAKKQWRGPFGKRTLAVTLWPPHAYWAQTNIRENDFVFLRNVFIRFGKNDNSKMEGALHTDKRYPDRIDVTNLSSRDGADDRVKEVLRRKRDYAKQFKDESKDFIEEARGQKRSGNDSEPLTKNQLRKKRKQEQKEKNKSDTNSLTGMKAARNELCPNIACSHSLTPPRPLSSILDTSKTHAHTTPNGTSIILPFQNICSRATVRVIDFFPPNLADFAVREKISEYDALSDNEDENEDEEDSQDEATDGSDDMSMVSSSVPSDAGSDITKQKKWKWAWRFCLLVEDINPGPGKEKVKLIVTDGDAEFLLDMEANNLNTHRKTLALLRQKLFILWGDLEERKNQITSAKTHQNPPKPTNLNPPTQKDHTFSNLERTNSGRIKEVWETPKSRPFQCCIKEYGVREGERWERRWRMFGTTISN